MTRFGTVGVKRTPNLVFLLRRPLFYTWTLFLWLFCESTTPLSVILEFYRGIRTFMIRTYRPITSSHLILPHGPRFPTVPCSNPVGVRGTGSRLVGPRLVGGP